MSEVGDYPPEEQLIERGKQFYDCITHLINAFPNVFGFTIVDDHIELVTKKPPSKKEQKQIQELLVRFIQCDEEHDFCKKPD